MHSRQRLRLSTLPDLYDIGRRPSLAQTTTGEITDAMIGLKPDAVAQEVAERYVRAAIAYRLKQAERAKADKDARWTQIVIAAEALKISVETGQGITDELVRLTSPTLKRLGFSSCCSEPLGGL